MDMLNFQVGMLSRQVDIQVQYLKERSEPVSDIHLEVVGIQEVRKETEKD